MAANITTITNVSKQAIPILIDSIQNESAQTGSNFEASRSESTIISPGAEVNIETNRVDLAQLIKLQQLKVIRFVAR